MDEWLKHISDFTAIELFALNDTKITVGGLIAVSVIVLVTFALNALLRRGVTQILQSRKTMKDGQIESIVQLQKYLVYAIGLGIALHFAGFNMSSMLAAGAVFGVAIGFAMQTIIQNFISGIILMVENSVRPGDILRVEGLVVKVQDIRIRSTIVRTLADEDLILPNSTIVANSVINYTLLDSSFRLMVQVGVAYESDLRKTEKALKQAADSLSKQSRVLLSEFADSSVTFTVSIWTDKPWEQNIVKSELLFAIWDALKDDGIVIAFPQLDVHFDESVEKLRAS